MPRISNGIFYHWTYRDCLDSILKEGLRPNGMGFFYLSPNADKPGWGSLYRDNQEYEVLLKVKTENMLLSCFDGNEAWEIMCWGHVAPENITVLHNGVNIVLDKPGECS